MTPQARLQPKAFTSILCMSSGPAVATRSEPVMVRNMITPKSISAMRSLGSSTRLVDLTGSSDIVLGAPLLVQYFSGTNFLPLSVAWSS